MQELPAHYPATFRRLTRFAAVFLFVGITMGLVSTEFQKDLRFTHSPTDAPGTVVEGQRTLVALPPGLNWEVGFDMRISHGHFILIGGVIPLCLAASLLFLHVCGARPLPPGLLGPAFWLYAVGACGALALITYKGWYGFASVQAGVYDMERIRQGMFGGSKALRAVSHALSHTVLSAGLGLISFGLWRAAGTIPGRTAR